MQRHTAKLDIDWSKTKHFKDKTNNLDPDIDQDLDIILENINPNEQELEQENIELEIIELDFTDNVNKCSQTEKLTQSQEILEDIIQELHHNKTKQKNLNSKDPTDIYLKEVGIAPLLSKEEEIHYSRLTKKGDLNARKKMIESNLRLVIKIARRYLRSGMAILDLIEEGNLGLMHAVEKFDPERGFRFSTYSAWWIQQTIERAIMSQNRTIRLPMHIMKKVNSCLRIKNELAKQLNHEPTYDDIANKLSKSEKEIEKTLCLNEKIISIDAPISDNFNKSLVEIVGTDILDPAKIVSIQSLKKAICMWLSKLTSTQKSVVELRFGLNNQEASTLEQTGVKIGLTRERVRQLQTEALRSLKMIVEEQGIDFNTLADDT